MTSKTLKASVEFAHKEANEAKTIATTLQTDVYKLKTELQNCRMETKQLREQNLRIETYNRRNNIKFDGIPEAKTDSKTYEISCLICLWMSMT